MVGLAVDDLPQPRRHLLGDRAPLERGDRVGDGAERIAQLVGQRGEELVLGAVGLGRVAVQLGVLQEDAGQVADALQQPHLAAR